MPQPIRLLAFHGSLRRASLNGRFLELAAQEAGAGRGVGHPPGARRARPAALRPEPRRAGGVPAGRDPAQAGDGDARRVPRRFARAQCLRDRGSQERLRLGVARAARGTALRLARRPARGASRRLARSARRCTESHRAAGDPAGASGLPSRSKWSCRGPRWCFRQTVPCSTSARQLPSAGSRHD